MKGAGTNISSFEDALEQEVKIVEPENHILELSVGDNCSNRFSMAKISRM